LKNHQEIGNFLSHFSINTHKLIEKDFDELYHQILLDNRNVRLDVIEEILCWYEFIENYERCKTLNDILKNED
jgi:hypothetical protein